MKTEEILNEPSQKKEYEFWAQYAQTPAPIPGERVKLTAEQQAALLQFQSFIQGQS